MQCDKLGLLKIFRYSTDLHSTIHIVKWEQVSDFPLGAVAAVESVSLRLAYCLLWRIYRNSVVFFYRTSNNMVNFFLQIFQKWSRDSVYQNVPSTGHYSHSTVWTLELPEVLRLPSELFIIRRSTIQKRPFAHVVKVQSVYARTQRWALLCGTRMQMRKLIHVSSHFWFIKKELIVNC